MRKKTSQECVIELRKLRSLKTRIQRHIDSHESALRQLKAALADCEDRLLGIEVDINSIIRRGRICGARE